MASLGVEKLFKVCKGGQERASLELQNEPLVQGGGLRVSARLDRFTAG